MKLNNNLLSTPEDNSIFNSSLNGTNIRGSYSTMQFVLRLRDDVRSQLNENIEETYDKIQAFSTYLHENIHYWQHIGSNYGFLNSLSFPAFSTICLEELRELIKKEIKVKPIIKFDKDYYEKNKRADIPEINRILNTYYDIEYAKGFAMDNKNIEHIAKDKRFFLSIGHCYHIFWSSTINTLQIFDKDLKILPNIDSWVSEFKKLEETDHHGFGIDIPIGISPLGIKAIFEGQAIFNQLQYLSISLDGQLTYDECEKAGMLYGIYIEAFELFLKITKFEKSQHLLDNTISLFLLICDIAINPTNGFPLEIHDFENFITKNDPGIRFTYLCKVISEDLIFYYNSIDLHSNEEYTKLSEILNNKIGCISNQQASEHILSWFEQPEIKKILEEESIHKFTEENLAVRLLFSKFLRFQEDKTKYANVFCWIGYHMTGKNKTVDLNIVEELFNKHKAPFVDSADKEIKATLFRHINEEQLLDTFNRFYQFHIMYDLILRWVYEAGEYKYDYKWLSNKEHEKLTPIIKNGFELLFGISPDDLKIL